MRKSYSPGYVERFVVPHSVRCARLDMTVKEDYEWVLSMRIALSVGALEPWAGFLLDEFVNDWNSVPVDAELVDAFRSKNPGLIRAFEIWWDRVTRRLLGLGRLDQTGLGNAARDIVVFPDSAAPSDFDGAGGSISAQTSREEGRRRGGLTPRRRRVPPGRRAKGRRRRLRTKVRPQQIRRRVPS